MIKGLNLMIADFCRFCGWKPRFSIKWVGLRSKTAVFSVVFKSRRSQDQKPQFSAKKLRFLIKWVGLRSKTVVFSVVFKSRRSQDQKPQFLAENCGFQCSFQMWEEPRPKSMVFGQKPWIAVFKSGRSQGLKLPKTTVFGQKLQFFQCGFQMWEEPKTKNHSFWPKTMVFSAVFKSGRSSFQRSKTPKTVVFGQKQFSVSFQCGFPNVGGA